MSTTMFYSDLPTLEDLLDLTDSSNFVDIPEDWYILVTDITNSTQAIESGRYKEINLLGACSIVAVLNIAKDIEIPFIFGGDGASILIPPTLLQPALNALLAIQQLARTSFSLELRVGAVPTPALQQANLAVKVAKLRISDNYTQSNFTGGGLSYATQLVKAPNTSQLYTYKSSQALPDANLFGLECRWQDIYSHHGETVCLIVQATANNSEQQDRTYRELIEKIKLVYGSERYFHPVDRRQLQLSFRTKQLSSEAQLRSDLRHGYSNLCWLLRIKLENILGFVFMQFGIKVGDMNWGEYKQLVIESTDYQKFDDMLRLVIASNATQRQTLSQFLAQQYQLGELVYGIHVTDRALMTCLVFERNGQQVHFIDGADGGYALAAKAMKARVSQQGRKDRT